MAKDLYKEGDFFWNKKNKNTIWEVRLVYNTQYLVKPFNHLMSRYGDGVKVDKEYLHEHYEKLSDTARSIYV